MENTIESKPGVEQPQLPLENPEDSASSLLQQRIAAAIIGLSLLLGFVGNLLFFDRPTGVNVPLYMLLGSVGLLSLLWSFQQQVYLKNLVFLLPMLLAALMMAFRSSEPLALFNFLLMLASLFVVLHFARDVRFLGGNWQRSVVLGIFDGIIGWWMNVLEVLVAGDRWRQRLFQGREQFSRFEPVLRGLLLTIPIVLVFALLLGSADVVFGDLLAESLGWLVPDATWLQQGMFIAVLAWLAIAGLKIPLMGLPSLVESNSPLLSLDKAPLSRFRLGMVESGMILGSVNALFLLFVLIQARYLFGGEANITAQGYTYAEYARRGFWELLLVSVMTLALVLGTDTLTRRSTPAQQRGFHFLVSLMIALTFVLLVAAMRRLLLYEDAYGFTVARVLAQIFIVWLGGLFFVLWAEVLHWKGIFFPAAVLMAIGFVLSLNFINLEGFVAQRNIERFHDTGKIDLQYLVSLSDDAIPSIATLIDDEALSEGQRIDLLNYLGERQYRLDNDREARGWLSYHWGKARAWEALDAHRDTLAPYYKPPRWFY